MGVLGRFFEEQPDETKQSIRESARGIYKSGRDILVYQGVITRAGYVAMTNLCSRPKRQKEALVILVTPGGDPNAAYRIARCLGASYDRFAIFVPTFCKSAGTLICVGAHELVIADMGELGPLDMQISKRDEVHEMGSGLDLLQVVGNLEEYAYTAFHKFLVDIRKRYQISTKIAAEMAAQLAVGLYGHIVNQLDPAKLGEINRTMLIAHEYGKRLADKYKNAKEGTIPRLVTKYTTHGFVIDRKEAKELFHRVRAPTAVEDFAAMAVGTELYGPQPHVYDLLDELERTEDTEGSFAEVPGAAKKGRRKARTIRDGAGAARRHSHAGQRGADQRRSPTAPDGPSADTKRPVAPAQSK